MELNLLNFVCEGEESRLEVAVGLSWLGCTLEQGIVSKVQLVFYRQKLRV